MCSSMRSLSRLACCVLLALQCTVFAEAESEDAWPCYGHDVARSHVTAATLTLPLHEQWSFSAGAAPEPAWDNPKPVPVEGYLELPRMRFDDVYHVVAADGMAYFASAAENKVYALDLATGETKWTFYTNAAPRLAPALYEGRIYFGADDGNVYCLDAATGAPVWKFRPAPEDRWVLGHGRMLSVWPVRTGVLIDDGILYCAAGVFPSERIFLCAVRASDGELLWRNDTMGDLGGGQSRFSPQGYLLASADRLFVPTGRSMPAYFDRKTGRYLGQRNIGKSTAMVGGTYALLADNKLYTGVQEIAALDQRAGGASFAWFRGHRLVVTPETSYLLDDKGLASLARGRYPELSRQRKQLELKRRGLEGQLRGQRDKTVIANIKKQIAEVDKQAAALDETIAGARPWRFKQEGLQSLILAGNLVLSGGRDVVVAVDAASGEKKWSAPVEGAAKSLAVAEGRLLVSTDKGTVYCFGPEEEAVRRHVPETKNPDNAWTRVCAQAAEQIVSATGVTRGYCLVWGCGTGALAAELARRTNLVIYAVGRKPAEVTAARRLLSDAGLYGTRVTVHQSSLAKPPYTGLPHPDYFANLIVSEEALRDGRVPGPAAECYRMLKPVGGVLYIGQPAGIGSAKPLPADAVTTWLRKAGIEGAVTANENGVWTKLVRGKLPETDDWSHQYGDPGNSGSTSDRQVRCPLGLLWYGEPGPDKVVTRHEGAAAPLVVNGRCFLQGELEVNAGKTLIMCFDVYNGVKYWERSVPGAKRTAMFRLVSNLAATDDSLFVATGGRCLRLDAATGETRATYAVPKTEAPRKWGYIAVADGVLYGSTTPSSEYGDGVFAIDLASGGLKWFHRGQRIKHNTIAVDGGRVMFADSSATPEQRREALKSAIEELVARKNITAEQAEKELSSADVRMVIALDARTGETLWEKPVDLTDCGGPVLVGIAHRGVYLFCGAHRDGHFWPQFLRGEYKARRVTALSADDGRVLWSKAIGYRIRPLVIGDTLYAEPWAFDLRTGEQRMRTHPITGQQVPWQFERPGHHCGAISGAPQALFFRSYTMAYYDLIADAGTSHWGGQRTGCWINMIPADGLVVAPEGSSGCVCPFPIQTTVVLQHRRTNKAWGVFSSPGESRPVRDLCVNLGGAGDRRDESGKLWFGFPRPFSRMRVDVELQVSGYAGGGYFNGAAELVQVGSTYAPWRFASGYDGVRRCIVPLVKPGEGAALYDLQLGFTDQENTQPGERVFDVKVQGKVVAKDFDIIAAAGGPGRAAFLDVKDVRVDGDLSIEFLARSNRPPRTQAPLLNCLSLTRTRTLNVGMSVADWLLNDRDRTRTQEVRLANNTNRAFHGRLEVATPSGFRSQVSRSQLDLEPGDKTTVDLTVAVVAAGEPRDEVVRVRLVHAGGAVEVERKVRLEYLGRRGREVIKASEDSYVNAGRPTTNNGHGASLLVDGGNGAMGDSAYGIAYLKFPLKVPGKAVAATLRIHTSPSEGSESGNSGEIRLIETPWEEYKIAFANRPKPGAVLAQMGRVTRDAWHERKLTVDLSGRSELSLAIVPTTTDGANYVSREGQYPPELLVEYELPPE